MELGHHATKLSPGAPLMGVGAQITASRNTRRGVCSVRLEHRVTFLEVSIFTPVKHPLLFSIFFVSNRRSLRWLSEGCSVLTRGFMDLLRRRTSENTGRWKKTAATFASPPPPHPILHCLAHFSSLSAQDQRGSVPQSGAKHDLSRSALQNLREAVHLE